MGSTIGLAAGRGVAWNQVIDQSGASATGWANRGSHNVSVSGGVFVCASSGNQARWVYEAVPIGQLAIMETELRFTATGGGNAQIGIGVGSSAFAGVVADFLTTGGDGTGASVRVDRWGVAGGPAWSHADWVIGTWYKLRVIRFGATYSVYVDGILIGTGDVNADQETTYLLLTSYNVATEWRNIKAWNGVFTDVQGSNALVNDRGVFAASTAYVNGDIVTYAGSRFIRTGTPFTSGSTFSSANWVPLDGDFSLRRVAQRDGAIDMIDPLTALVFPGSADAQRIITNAIVNNALGLNDKFSVEGVFKVAGAGSVGSGAYACLFSGASNNRYLIDTSSGALLGQFNGTVDTAAGAFPINSEFHFVHTFNNGASPKNVLYVNGVAKTITTDGDMRASSNLFSMLTSYNGGNYVLNGTMGFWATYFEVLTPAKIAEHYAAYVG